MKKLQAAIEAEKDPNAQALGGVLMEICKLSPQALELVEQDLDCLLYTSDAADD